MGIDDHNSSEMKSNNQPHSPTNTTKGQTLESLSGKLGSPEGSKTKRYKCDPFLVPGSVINGHSDITDPKSKSCFC